MSRAEHTTTIERHTKRKAKQLARFAGQAVGIGHDESLTVGNVTFSKSEHERSVYADLLPVVAFYSDESWRHEGLEPRHTFRGSTPVEEPGWDGWQDNVIADIERPTDFAQIIDPPGRVKRAALYILEGRIIDKLIFSDHDL